MNRQEFSDPDLNLILEISGNNQCFDCLSKNPRFCSVNNGVLLCGICAREHQYFNHKVSRIKSLEADLWSKEEIKYLRLGGNTRFNNLLVEYEIPNDLENQDYKYHTKIADYYRTLLAQETRNRICLLKRPTLQEGKQTIEKVPNNNNILNNNNINNNNNKINFNEGMKENNFIDNESEYIYNENNNLNNQTNNNDDNYIFGVKHENNNTNNQKKINSSMNLNSMLNSINSFFKEVGDKINEKSKEYDIDGKINNIKNSDTYKSVSEKFDKGINFLQKKTNELIKDINSTSEYEFYAQQEVNNQLNSNSNYNIINSQNYNSNYNYNNFVNNNNQNQYNNNLNSNANLNNNNNDNKSNNINNNNPVQTNINNYSNYSKIENNIGYDNINANINDINAFNINESEIINKNQENNKSDKNQKNEEKLD